MGRRLIAMLAVVGLPAWAQAQWAISVGVGGYPHACRPYYRPYIPTYRPYYPVAVPVYVPYWQPEPAYVAIPAPPPPPPQPQTIEDDLPNLAPPPRRVEPPASELPSQPVPVEPVAAVKTVARPATPRPIETLLRALSNPEESARMTAVEQLGESRSSRAIDPVAATLAGDRSPAVRYAAATALGRLGSRKAMPALYRAAAHDADEAVRGAANESIRSLRSVNGAVP